jgi:uncharacterized membrane protein YphA (DoxX/SURF4 family)
VALAGFLALEGATVASGPVWASTPGPEHLMYGITVIALGLLVAAGFLTPIVQAIVVAVESASLVVRIQTAGPVMLTTAESQLPMLAIAIALALALIGPGGYSVDGRLFGRREIVVGPRANNASRPRSASTRK